MNLVEGYILSHEANLWRRNARREAKRRDAWESTLSRHHRIMVAILGAPLCAEIELEVPAHSRDRTHRFPCKIFDLECFLTVTHAPSSTHPDTDAHLKFNTEVDGKDVFSVLLSGEPIGEAFYVLRRKTDKLLKPLAMRERLWFPYHYYELTYSALCQDGDGLCIDTFTADVTSAEPDEDGWYYVLNFAYASEEEHARPTKFANMVKVVRKLAEEPDRSRDKVIRMKDEESGDEYRVYTPRVGVEQA